MTNRRIFLRYAMRLPVRYAVITPREADLGRLLFPHKERTGMLLDLGGGGMRLLTEATAGSGFLAVRFSLPTFPSGTETVFGRVVHRETRPATTREIVRTRFENIPEPLREHIIRFVFEKEATSPYALS